MSEEKILTVDNTEEGRERLLTPKDVSEMLQIRLSTIYHWVQTRAIPFFKIGRHIRFKVRDLEKWLEKQRRGKFSLR